MAEQGAERFMAKWIAVEKARAGHAVVCPNVTRRTKERITQNKRARAGSLALVDWPQVARITCILLADAVLLSLSGVTFVLFCFVTPTVVWACVLFRVCFFLFLFLWRCRFFE